MNKKINFKLSEIKALPYAERKVFELLKSFDDSKSFIGFDSKTIINLFLNYDNDEILLYLFLHTLWKGNLTSEITASSLSLVLGWNKKKITKILNDMEQDKLIIFKATPQGYEITCLQDFRRNRADNCEIPVGHFQHDYCHECSIILNKELDDSEQKKNEFGNSEQYEYKFGNSEQPISKFGNTKQEQFGNSEQSESKFENAEQFKFGNPEQFGNPEHTTFDNTEHTEFDNAEQLKSQFLFCTRT